MFFARRKRQDARPPAVPEGIRVYAIGDVHGCYAQLAELIDKIAADDRDRGGNDTHVVMLGDLIDRGPRSAEVVGLFADAPPAFARFRFLMGNHEEAMLESLAEHADPRATGWLRYGGRETLVSYGVPDSAFALGGWLFADALRQHVPQVHLDFLASFEDQIGYGDYLFVHAGIRPKVPLERQTKADLRWIREPFLQDSTDHGRIVVHGHSVEPEPVFRANRIGIDTGAYRTGRLTALGLEGAERWTISVGGGAGR